MPVSAADPQQARISLQSDRFRLRFSLLARQLDRAAGLSTRDQSRLQLQKVITDARETVEAATKAADEMTKAKGRVAKRSRRLLTEMLIPSIRLLLAGALVERGVDAFVTNDNEAEQLVESVGSIIESVTKSPQLLTYRVRYNLACLWARIAARGVPVPPSRDATLPGLSTTSELNDPKFQPSALGLAYNHLDAGLRDAPFGEQLGLAKWASDDPSLAALRDSEATADATKLLLTPYLTVDGADVRPGSSLPAVPA